MKVILCPKCNKPMEKYDRDFMFDGCYDTYLECDDCKIDMIEKTRYGNHIAIKEYYDGKLEKCFKCYITRKEVTPSEEI